MINVCAKYCGSVILLDSFKDKSDADEFMKHDYVLFYADEIENGTEDEVIHPEEMFIENELPFFEPQITDPIVIDLDELPF